MKEENKNKTNTALFFGIGMLLGLCLGVLGLSYHTNNLIWDNIIVINMSGEIIGYSEIRVTAPFTTGNLFEKLNCDKFEIIDNRG